MTHKVTDADLAAFTVKVQGIIDAYWTKMNYTHSKPDQVSFTIGPKYARIVLTNTAQRSVYGFVDLSNGNLLKAASWASPAKHARGNLFSATPLAGCTPHGMAYIVR